MLRKRHMQTERTQNALGRMQSPHRKGYTSQHRDPTWKEANPPFDRCLDVKQWTIAAAIRSG